MMRIVRFKGNDPQAMATYCFEDAAGRTYLLRFGSGSAPVKGLSPDFFDRCAEAEAIKVRCRDEGSLSIITEIVSMK